VTIRKAAAVRHLRQTRAQILPVSLRQKVLVVALASQKSLSVAAVGPIRLFRATMLPAVPPQTSNAGTG